MRHFDFGGGAVLRQRESISSPTDYPIRLPTERGSRLVGTVYAKLNRHAKADSSWSRENERASTGYVVVVTISRMGIAVSPFSPLRLGESDGPAFSSDTDALMVGYSAAQRIVDDLLSADTDQR
jgi:hypothetical protein